MHRTIRVAVVLVAGAGSLAPGARAQCATAKLLPGDGQPGDQFGVAVAIHEPWALVGASLHDEASDNTGAVYVLRRDDRGTPLVPGDDLWIQHVELSPPAAPSLQVFGVSLGFDEPWVAIGASFDSDSVPISGAVHLYLHQDAGTPDDPTDDRWSFQAKLKESPTLGLTGFGGVVALDGSWLAAGTPFDDTVANNAGAVVVFRRDDAGTPGHPADDTWTQRDKLLPALPAERHFFGQAVALADGTLVIGAPKNDSVGPSGTAHVYRLTDDTWQPQAELLSDDRSISDYFGTAVAIETDWLFVGAPGDDEVAENVGAVYVFRRDDNGTPGSTADDTWPLHAKLTIAADGVLRFAALGGALAIDGDTLVAGATADFTGSVQGGSAFVFRRSDSGTPGVLSDDVWLAQERLVAEAPANGDQFGWAVAIDDGTALVGARFDDDLGLSSGSVRVFALETGAWQWLGQALAGSAGPPCLFGAGTPSAGQPLAFMLHAAPASSPVVVVLGASAIEAPFKGGVFVPAPDRMIIATTSPDGELSATANWPAGIPAGAEFWTQVWAVDPTGPAGWVASNALKLSVP